MDQNQIVNAMEMKQLDKLTIQEKAISSYELMNVASKEVFFYLFSNKFINSTEDILVIAGTGNNGGDALLTALHISRQGMIPNVILVGEESNQSEDNLHAMEELKDNNIPVIRLHNKDEVEHFNYLFEQASLILDGIFGIGLSREVEGCQKQVINAINQSFANIISIDIPSGINADNGVAMGAAVRANITLVIQNYKQGNLLNDAKDYSGKTVVLDVGILQTYFPERQTILTTEYLNSKFPERRSNSHKYHFGHVLTIGGGKGMMGAPILSAYGALRTGAGLSGVLVRDKLIKYLQNPYPDVMVDSYLGVEELPSILRKKTCIIFGPGLGRNDQENIEVLTHLLSTDIPLLVDADGIYYLKQVIHKYNERKHIIITPHHKEMARFLDVEVDEIVKEPVLYAKNIAHTYNLTVVLKGTCTLITNSDETYFSIEGNAGLATAGTGDVLSGIIGALLGQGYSAIEAAKLGVLIHSKAAAFAKEQYGETSMIASDVIRYIPEVIKRA